MPPQQSYFICMSPRTGSSFLSAALNASGHAGWPEEYYTADDQATLLRHYEATTLEFVPSEYLSPSNRIPDR